MKDKSTNLLAGVIALVVILAIVAAVYAGIWKLWCWVLETIWPTGPAMLIHPSYWLFLGVLTLIGIVGKVMAGK